MNDIKKQVLKEQSLLNSKIEDKSNVLLLAGISKIGRYDNILAKVKGMQVMINQCIQYGNYRRAYKLILIINKYIDNFLKNERNIIDMLTELIIKG